MMGLQPGDRVPDFSRPDATGKPRFFYDVHHGQPVALFVCGRAGDPNVQKALAALTRPDQRWGQVTRVALVQGTAAELKLLDHASADNLLLVADDGSLSRHLLGNAPAVMTALTLDDNLRLVERIELGGDADEFEHRVARSYAERPLPEARLFQRQAPVLF